MFLPQEIRLQGQELPTTLHLGKKLVARLPYPVAACPDNNVFFLTDPEMGYNYLVDTGASRSLFPRSHIQRNLSKSSETLRAANGSTINTFGTTELPITVNRRRYSWKFLVADVFLPILGADFLGFYNLVVDVRQHRLIDATSFPPSGPSNTISTTVDEYARLLTEFPSVFNASLNR